MKFFRFEEIEIEPGKDENAEDIRALIDKTQDLTLDTLELLDYKKGYRVKVKRQLESFPDTIK